MVWRRTTDRYHFTGRVGVILRKQSQSNVQRAAPTAAAADARALLPDLFHNWFGARGWRVRPHQLALVRQAAARRSTLLIAPTGAGKTLAGFLPSLLRLHKRVGTEGNTPAARARKGAGLSTLYISPLKALSVDVARNLETPIRDMGLDVSVETRSADTPVGKRTRQRRRPPDILLTTPEQVALLLAHEDASYLFADLDTIIIDELHALSGNKRGDLLALDLARLRKIAGDLMTIGLSATVAMPSLLRAYLVAQDTPCGTTRLADLVEVREGVEPDIDILELDDPVPWGGHSARYAMQAVLDAIARHKLSLLFVNTRMQAELVFRELWRINDDNLRIALHHGSLDVAQRRKVEAAMAEGRLDAVVATSTLDLGIDWGDVNLVVHIGAPKGASRLAQRVGRSNHRLDEPSRALLVPSNRFEVLECRAALEAAKAGAQDNSITRTGALDVLSQHILGMACQAPFETNELYREVTTAVPYAALTRETFDRVVDYVSTGGYALKAYEKYARLKPTEDGKLRLAHPKLAQTYRLNAGTIVDNPLIKVRLTRPRKGRRGATEPVPGAVTGGPRPLAGGRVLGEVEESFIDQLSPGDTFAFAGEVLRFEGLVDMQAYVSRAAGEDPMIPSFAGGKFPLSTHLAARVRRMLADQTSWRKLPEAVREWLELQSDASAIAKECEVLIETFPRANKHYLVAYPFEGRLAHQTLGMLLTRRLQRAGARPLGFVANDYGLSVWGFGDLSQMLQTGDLDLEELFEEDMLGDDLESWLAESNLMKRTFRNVAVISGLIERRHPGLEKSGRQVTMSTDLIYDVLRNHDPGHVLLEAAWADAAAGLLDIARLGDFLCRIKGAIRHCALERVSPLSVPILLEIGREAVAGQARDNLLREAAAALIEDASIV